MGRSNTKMLTVRVRITHRHNVEQVKKALGAGAYEKGDCWFVNTARPRDQVDMMVIGLNCLHGVQARILEMPDAKS